MSLSVNLLQVPKFFGQTTPSGHNEFSLTPNLDHPTFSPQIYHLRPLCEHVNILLCQ